MKKILLTGAGAPGGPGIIKALLQAGYTLLTADANPLASGRFLHPDFIQIPRADDDNFIPAVLNTCLENKIEVVFPLVTRELLKLSAAKADFAEQGVKVIVSAPQSLAVANDKGKLYQHLTAKAISTPRFHIVETIEELTAAVKRFGYPANPVCIKPTISNGSRGVRILQETIDEYDLFFHHKPYHLYSNLEKICAVLEGKRFPPLLVSEFLPGTEFTVDTIVQNGVPKVILPRSREKMNGGISVQGTFIHHEKIIAYCEQIIRSLQLSGPIGLQVKEDSNGDYKILEINPRIQGTSVAALGIGINLPSLAIQQEFGPIEIDTSAIPWGTSFVRFYNEAFYK